MRRAASLVLIGLLADATRLTAQFPPAPPGPDPAAVRGESPQARKRLTEIEAQLRAGKTEDAADELQKVLDESGDDLVAADGGRYLPARRYAHRLLGQLPPTALAAYRDRVDEPARRLLDRGTADRDPRPLRRLVAQYFVSRPAEDALLLLGELAFERGDFRAAAGYWQRLLPDAAGEEFAYPGPRSDPAAIRAKVALAHVYAGDLPLANVQLDLLKAKNPAATGRLAGKDGPYAELLAGIIANPPRPAAERVSEWTTLGGGPSRGGRASGLSPYLPSRPARATPLPRDPAADRDAYPVKPPPVGAARCVAFHPIVVGNRAFVADAGRVLAFDLTTGAASVAYDVRREEPFGLIAGDLKIPTRFDADYALAADGNALYARLGGAALFPPPTADRPAERRASFLVALDITPDGVKARWAKLPPVPAGITAAWEGAPVASDGRVVAAFAKTDAGRITHAFAAFDPAGRLLWTCDLADASAGDGRTRHELPTVAGPNVVFCTHAGAVVAVDLVTGKPAWAFRYPRVRRVPGDSRYRDVNPPVAADGRVFVAPTDAEYLYALDAETGRLLWQDGPIQVDQVIGVSGGKVVCTIAGPVRGVRGYDAATGSTTAPAGWANHDDPGLSSFGRGLLSDDYFFWPTQAGLFTLRLRDGTPARQPLPGPHGNLAFAAGMLLCATPTELWGFPVPGSTTPTPPVRIAVGEPLPGFTPVPATISSARPMLKLPPKVETRTAAALPISTGRVVTRLGDRHLVSVDRASGTVSWVLDARKRPRYDPFAGGPTNRFLPPVYADESRVIVFTAAGRRWVIDANSGVVDRDDPGVRAEFTSVPVRATETLIAVATGPGEVAAFDPRTGGTAWSYSAPRPAGLSGVAPRLWANEAGVFVALGRNIGVDIECLRPETGDRLWPAGPAFTPADRLDPSATAVDPDNLYVPASGTLTAFRLDTGRPLWDIPLPPGEWAALAAANAVAVVPREAVANEPFADVSPRVARAFARRPDLRRLPGLLVTLYDAWADRAVPVLLLDPTTGRELHRVVLPARGPTVEARLSNAGLIIRTATTEYRIP